MKVYKQIMGGLAAVEKALMAVITIIVTVITFANVCVRYLTDSQFGWSEEIVVNIFVLMIMSGALMTSSLAWDISDTFNGLMMIPNLIGVIAMSGIVMKVTKNYIDRKKRGLDVEPIISYDKKIQAAQVAQMKEDGEL